MLGEQNIADNLELGHALIGQEHKILLVAATVLES
jgi:hypothetical protein